MYKVDKISYELVVLMKTEKNHNKSEHHIIYIYC